MRRFAPALLGLILTLAPAGAGAAPGISVDGAWCVVSRARPGTAFVYLTLTLRGEPEDQLTGAATDAASRAAILTPHMVRGREVLQPASAIPLGSEAPTVFQPEDTHIVLSGLQRPLAPGDAFTLSLHFASAAAQDVLVKVVRQPPSAGMPDLPSGLKLE
jgi:copper(I)-binding protein